MAKLQHSHPDTASEQTLRACRDLLCGSQFVQKEDSSEIQFCPTCPSEQLEWTCKRHHSCINCCRNKEVILPPITHPSEHNLFSLVEGPARQCGGWAALLKADNSLCCPLCQKPATFLCMTHWRCSACCGELTKVDCVLCCTGICTERCDICRKWRCRSCALINRHNCIP